MNKKIWGGALLVLIIIGGVFVRNYYQVKQNWDKINTIQFTKSSMLQITLLDSNNRELNKEILSPCEQSGCKPLKVHDVEVHLASESTLNILFSTELSDKNKILDLQLNRVKIESSTGVLTIN